MTSPPPPEPEAPPTFGDFGTIDKIAVFHRGDVRNMEVDEKKKAITWWFRVVADVEINGKMWIVDDDRARITKKYFNEQDFQAMRHAFQQSDNTEEAEFRIHNANYSNIKE